MKKILVFMLCVCFAFGCTVSAGAFHSEKDILPNKDIAGTIYVGKNDGDVVFSSTNSKYAAAFDVMIQTVDASNNLYKIGAYVYMGPTLSVMRINLPFVCDGEPGLLSYNTTSPRIGETIFMYTPTAYYLTPGTHHVTLTTTAYVDYLDFLGNPVYGERLLWELPATYEIIV